MSYDDLSRPEGKHNEMIMNANAGESNPVSSFVKEAVVIIPLRRRFTVFKEEAGELEMCCFFPTNTYMRVRRRNKQTNE